MHVYVGIEVGMDVNKTHADVHIMAVAKCMQICVLTWKCMSLCEVQDCSAQIHL